MHHSWIVERRRILALLVAILVLGGLSGHWAFAIGLPTSIYIGLQLLQLYRLERWLKRGFKPREVPETSGAWESIISRL